MEFFKYLNGPNLEDFFIECIDLKDLSNIRLPETYREYLVPFPTLK